MEEIDIWRTAKILIDAHGEGASIEAAMRADQGVEDGNGDVVKVWKRVMTAIDELQRHKPADGESVN